MLLNPETLTLIVVALVYAAIIAIPRMRSVISIVGVFLMAYVVKVVHLNDLTSEVLIKPLIILFGLMALGGLLRESGFFTYLVRLAVKLSSGRGNVFFLTVCAFTCLLSALIGNTLAAYFMVLATVSSLKELNVDPKPYVISEIILANIAGTATLIGEPSNIVIGSWLLLSFNLFVARLGWIVTICAVTSVLLLLYLFRERLSDIPSKVDLNMNGEHRILMIGGIASMIASIVLLFLGIEPVAALSVLAMAILFFGGRRTERIMANMEWSTFIYVGSVVLMARGLQNAGATVELARLISSWRVDLFLSSLLFSFLLSTFLDDLQTSALMVPTMANLISVGDFPPWWALIMGLGFGSAASSIGSYTTIISLQAARREGCEIGGLEYLKKGLLISTVSLTLTVILFLIGERVVP